MSYGVKTGTMMVWFQVLDYGLHITTASLLLLAWLELSHVLLLHSLRCHLILPTPAQTQGEQGLTPRCCVGSLLSTSGGNMKEVLKNGWSIFWWLPARAHECWHGALWNEGGAGELSIEGFAFSEHLHLYPSCDSSAQNIHSVAGFSLGESEQ